MKRRRSPNAKRRLQPAPAPVDIVSRLARLAVAANGIPLEAMLENSVFGAYHGYPMPDSDPLAEVVAQRWLQA